MNDIEGLDELKKIYNLEEDIEHIIIPIVDTRGRKNRCFILKRRLLRIVFSDGHFEDFPIQEIIEAIIKYPLMLLSESIRLVHKEVSLVTDEKDNSDVKIEDK